MRTQQIAIQTIAITDPYISVLAARPSQMGASGIGMDIDAMLIGPTQPNRRFAPNALSSYSMPYTVRKGKPEATTSTWSEPPCVEFLA